MGMRLQYVSLPGTALEALQADAELGPSLLVEETASNISPAMLDELRKHMTAAGMGQLMPPTGGFPRLVRDDEDDSAEIRGAAGGASWLAAYGGAAAGGAAGSHGGGARARGLARPDAVRGELEKSWHGLHFVLTGRADEAPAPLGLLLSGGVEVGEDLGYGAARFLSPAEVVGFRTAIKGISDAEFERRFDLAALERNEVYPGCWDEDRAELLEEYLDYFHQLQDDLDKTTLAGEGLLLMIT